MRKKIDSYLIISNGEEEKDKGVSCVVRIGIDNYGINEKGSMLVMDAVKLSKSAKECVRALTIDVQSAPLMMFSRMGIVV